MFHIWMSLQVRAKVAKGQQVFFREVTFFSQCCVESRRCVAFRKYKTIAVRIFWIFRVHVHFFKIQIRENIGCRQRSARMAGLCCMNATDDPFADLIGRLLKF